MRPQLGESTRKYPESSVRFSRLPRRLPSWRWRDARETYTQKQHWARRSGAARVRHDPPQTPTRRNPASCIVTAIRARPRQNRTPFEVGFFRGHLRRGVRFPTVGERHFSVPRLTCDVSMCFREVAIHESRFLLVGVGLGLRRGRPRATRTPAAPFLTTVSPACPLKRRHPPRTATDWSPAEARRTRSAGPRRPRHDPALSTHLR